jgi:hypothetical protein
MCILYYIIYPLKIHGIISIIICISANIHKESNYSEIYYVVEVTKAITPHAVYNISWLSLLILKAFCLFKEKNV